MTRDQEIEVTILDTFRSAPLSQPLAVTYEGKVIATRGIQLDPDRLSEKVTVHEIEYPEPPEKKKRPSK